LPLLSPLQKKKHVDFCVHLRNNWGLPRGKYLWIHYDEKWFYGMVLRANAKKCNELGLDKLTCFLYHKYHIDKVMAVAVTGFGFDGTVENGGDGLKIGRSFETKSTRIWLIVM
jgi:hypothetical protein